MIAGQLERPATSWLGKHLLNHSKAQQSDSRRELHTGHTFSCLSGAMDAGAAVGGIRISREAGTTVRTASYLPDAAAVFCRFLSSRKVRSCPAGVALLFSMKL